MSHLKQDLINDFISITEDCLDISHRMYGTTGTRLNLWNFENRENGISIRVIHDPKMIHAERQGIHVTESLDDEYELVEYFEQAERDGFDTIWLNY